MSQVYPNFELTAGMITNFDPKKHSASYQKKGGEFVIDERFAAIVSAEVEQRLNSTLLIRNWRKLLNGRHEADWKTDTQDLKNN